VSSTSRCIRWTRELDIEVHASSSTTRSQAWSCTARARSPRWVTSCTQTSSFRCRSDPTQSDEDAGAPWMIHGAWVILENRRENLCHVCCFPWHVAVRVLLQITQLAPCTIVRTIGRVCTPICSFFAPHRSLRVTGRVLPVTLQRTPHPAGYACRIPMAPVHPRPRQRPTRKP